MSGEGNTVGYRFPILQTALKTRGSSNQVLVSNAILQRKEPSIWREMRILGLGYCHYEMLSLEHLIMTESKRGQKDREKERGEVGREGWKKKERKVKEIQTE